MTKKRAILIIILIPVSLIIISLAFIGPYEEGLTIRSIVFLLAFLVFAYSAGQFKYPSTREPLIRALFGKEKD